MVILRIEEKEENKLFPRDATLALSTPSWPSKYSGVKGYINKTKGTLVHERGKGKQDLQKRFLIENLDCGKLLIQPLFR